MLIANPSTELTANIEASFLTGTGEVPGPAIALGPGRRASIKVDDYVDTYDVSTRITSTGAPVAAERATYVDRTAMSGATSSPGVTTSANTWYLTEGATRSGFETWILIANPDEAITADASIGFLTEAGEITGPNVSVPPRSRRSIRADDYVDTYDVSTRVTATGPGVIVERAMYGDTPAYGRTAASGEATGSLANDWVVAEGATGGGYATWILISNPDTALASTVDLAYMTDAGLIPGPTGLVIPPKSRRSVNVGATVDTYDVSTRVKVTSGPPVGVDRSLYMPPGLGQDSTSGPGEAVG